MITFALELKTSFIYKKTIDTSSEIKKLVYIIKGNIILSWYM